MRPPTSSAITTRACSNRQTWNNAALAGLALWFEDEDRCFERSLESPTGLVAHLHARLRRRRHVVRGRELPPLCAARPADRARLCPVGRARCLCRRGAARRASRRHSARRCSRHFPISPFRRGRTPVSASRSRSRCTSRTGKRASPALGTEGDLTGWLASAVPGAGADGDAARLVPARGGIAGSREAGQGRPLLVDACGGAPAIESRRPGEHAHASALLESQGLAVLRTGDSLRQPRVRNPRRRPRPSRSPAPHAAPGWRALAPRSRDRQLRLPRSLLVSRHARAQCAPHRRRLPGAG